MSKFNEVKENLIKQYNESGERKTFSETAFNQMGTAMLNIVEADDDINDDIKTAALDLRKSVITDVMKKTGHESDEINAEINSHTFGTLPLYGYVGNLIEEYLDTGKALRLPKKEDLNATLTMATIEEQEKSYSVPSKPGETVKYLEKKHRRIKVASSTPDALKEEIK